MPKLPPNYWELAKLGKHIIWLEGDEDHPVFASSSIGAEFQAFRISFMSWLRLSPQRVTISSSWHS